MVMSVISWFSSTVYHYQTVVFNPLLVLYVNSDLIQWPWLMYLIVLLSVVFIIPIIIFVSLYATALTMFIYRHRKQLDLTVKLNDYAHKRNWRGILYAIAVLWEAHGWIWHGFEIEGFDLIPDTGPAMIVYYHGALPLDHFYLMIKCFLYKKRLIHAVGDHFLFMIPGWRTLMREIKVHDGPPQECVKILNSGHLLSVSPGGTREALFGDERYKLLWNNRKGFAKVAIETKVPIIPVFTQNIREAFVAVKTGKGCLRRLYEMTKLPVVPIYGGFPVKLKTIIGEPILYDPNVTPDQLVHKTAEAIEELIQRNQRIPGNISHAFLDRFHQYHQRYICEKRQNHDICDNNFKTEKKTL